MKGAVSRLQELPRLPVMLERISDHLQRRGEVGLLTVQVLRPEQFEQRHGEEVFDRLLVQVARFLRTFVARAMRHDDEALETMISGNAFVLLVGPAREKKRVSLLDVRGACRRLEQALEEVLPDLLPADTVVSPFACGCTLLTGRGDAEDLEKRVYEALDDALGDALRRSERGTGEDERLLRRVLDDGALGTAFQPVVDLEERRVIGYEALSRPRVEPIITPERLFRIAHQQDALWRLERLARERALAAARHLNEEHLLFLNVDPDALLDPLLRGPETISRLKAAGLSPGRVVLELTENRALVNDKPFREAMKLFRRRGYRFALDDVGAGYAGLSTIAEISPDFLKLDMSLVRNLDRNPLKRGLVSTIREFAHRVDIRLVAEGVESVDELRVLRQVGVKLAQGYLFARPEESVREPDLLVLETEVAGPEGDEDEGPPGRAKIGS